MQNFKRMLNLKSLTQENSVFLFGPRGTGKSYLIRESFQDEALVINLLKISEYLRLVENPSLIEEMILLAKKDLVVIDEVQKLPILLDEVHRLIEEKRIRFLLTGSSIRKLKRGHANMLAGRARMAYLHPLIRMEIQDFDLDTYLLWGGLPELQHINDKIWFLDSYIESYLKEEVLAEQAARNLPHFSRFLKTAALNSGELLNFANVANDAQVAVGTVKNYFSVLNDTLLGSLLEPWRDSKKRKAIATAKFYFFDIGVRNRLLGVSELIRNSDLYGKSFEHFIYMELMAFCHYYKVSMPLNFWRSTSQHEVDFLLGDIAIEVKASMKVSKSHTKNLMALKEEGHHKTFLLVSQDPVNREDGEVYYFHWEEFLKRLWNRETPLLLI
jgi:predicted AAA+ superfamily ATPase